MGQVLHLPQGEHFKHFLGKSTGKGADDLALLALSVGKLQMDLVWEMKSSFSIESTLPFSLSALVRGVCTLENISKYSCMSSNMDRC